MTTDLLLISCIDGIVVDGHHIIAAVGVDEAGDKHLLGLALGASENAQVVKDVEIRLSRDVLTLGLQRSNTRCKLIGLDLLRQRTQGQQAAAQLGLAASPPAPAAASTVRP